MSDRFDRPAPWHEESEEEAPGLRHDADPVRAEPDEAGDALEQASENVLDAWPEPSEDVRSAEDARFSEEPGPEPERAADSAPRQGVLPPAVDEDAPARELPVEEPVALGSVAHEPHPDPAVHVTGEHAPGELVVPPGVPVLEGSPRGERRAVGVVVARFNGEVTSRLLASALDELRACGVSGEAVTVMPVPGAFELPLAAMALAKTRRFACIVALGCVIRGDTPHFDYVASEAASGLQLAAIETGVPVAFGVLTLDRVDQADARADKGAEAVRTALEMADLFAHLRAAAAR
jgi:6,7-dimethyl-8-ribityllumazine synthase